MTPCATVNAIATGLALMGLTIAACTSGSPPAQPPSPGGMATSSQTPLASAPVDIDVPSDPASQAKPKPKPPETVADCQELLAEMTNEPPDGGVVMNNAMTASDAGASDRLQPMVELMKANRDGFRCCFDLWARKNRGAEGRVTFVFDLNPDGMLREARVDRPQSTIHVDAIDACMVDLAKSLRYPKSPSGKDTKYTHRFEFKARH